MPRNSDLVDLTRRGIRHSDYDQVVYVSGDRKLLLIATRDSGFLVLGTNIRLIEEEKDREVQ